MLHRAQNLIDGRFVEAASGESYELFVDGSRASLGRWPRSNATDLARALVGLERAAPEWARRSADERLDRLWTAFEAWDDEPDPADRLARHLGLSRDEVEDLYEPTGASLDAWLAAGGAAPLAPGEHVVHLQDATETFGELARTTFRTLHRGGTVLVVSDPTAPMIADVLARALAPVADGAFALVHDDGRTVARAAAENPDVEEISIASTHEGLDDLRARRGPPRERVITAGFGAGLPCAASDGLRLRPHANSSVCVDEHLDVDAQARAIVERAFGRVSALSGLAPGSVGRVLCPRRVFSRFTERLLAAIEAHPDVRRPLSIVGRLAGEHLERAFSLGHDEGATAIYTGPTPKQRFPIVFTNVEEHMRLARETRPAPVMALMRVSDAARGRELAERLGAGTAPANPFRARGGGGAGRPTAQSTD